jgi:hypothetical protein
MSICTESHYSTVHKYCKYRHGLISLMSSYFLKQLQKHRISAMLAPLSALPLSSAASSVVRRKAICQKRSNPSSAELLLIHSIQQECRRKPSSKPRRNIHYGAIHVGNRKQSHCNQSPVDFRIALQIIKQFRLIFSNLII